MNNRLVGLAAILSAAFASICCIGPLILTGLGLGSLGLAAGLTPYRPLFLGLTALILTIGFYYAYRKRSVACADGTCEVRSGSKSMKAALWSVTALTALLATFPSWSVWFLSGRADQAQAPADAKTLALKVSGMTCAACTVSIKKAVEKIPGVYSASVDLDSGRATVLAKDGTDSKAVLRAVSDAGYKGEMEEGESHGKPRS